MVEEREAPVQAILVAGAGLKDAGENPLDPGSLGAAEFLVLQVDIVDDLGHFSESRIAGSDSPERVSRRCSGLPRA